MDEKKVFEKIEETYKTEKGKKFITHLIRSFFPVGKGTYLMSSELTKKRLRCCITGTRLVGKLDLVGAMYKVTPEEFGEYIRSTLDLGEDKEKNTVPLDHPAKKHLPNGAVLGIECKDSDKLICQSVYEQLYNFYATRLLQDDGHMRWLANSMMAKEGIKNLKKGGVNIKKKEERVLMKKINKSASISLGDLDVLRQLKDKIDKKDE